MTLIATVAATGLEVESFTTPSDVWAQWRKLPMGKLVIGRHRIPAVLKRSARGLQFFAAASGLGGTPAPESVEHWCRCRCLAHERDQVFGRCAIMASLDVGQHEGA
jgi:hypothetical protein